MADLQEQIAQVEAGETPAPTSTMLTEEQTSELQQIFFSKSEAQQRELANSRPEVFGRFFQGPNPGGRITDNVELEGQTNALSSLGTAALPLVGMGIGSFGGPVGTAIGAGLGTAAANVIDEAEGRQTTAVPFGGFMGFPTTGSATGDAVVETALDQIPILKALRAGGRTVKELATFPAFEFAARMLRGVSDPQFTKSIQAIEEVAGAKIPLVLAQDEVGNRFSRFISQISFGAGKLKDTARRETSAALNRAYQNAFGLDMIDTKLSNDVINGFNEGIEDVQLFTKKIKDGVGLSTADKEVVRSMVKTRRFHQKQLAVVAEARSLFQVSKPQIRFQDSSRKAIARVARRFDAVNTAFNPAFKEVQTIINKLDNLMTRTAKNPEVLDQFGSRIKPPTSKVSATLGGDQSAQTLMDLLNDLNGLSSKQFANVTKEQQSIITNSINQAKEVFERDVISSLNPEQLSALGNWRKAADNFSEGTNKLMNAVSAGEKTAFMETAARDVASAEVITRSIGTKESQALTAGWLFQKHTKPGGAVDFVSLARELDDPTTRAGYRALLGGSEPIQLLRNFANVAKGTDISKVAKGGGLDRMIGYGSIGVGAGFFINPVTTGIAVGSGAALVIGENAFFKRVLFNPEFGRQAAELTKLPTNSRRARQGYLRLMALLNGTEATAVVLGPKGEVKESKTVIIRSDENGSFVEPKQFIPPFGGRR